MGKINPFLKYDNKLIHLCFNRMDYEFCRYCGLYSEDEEFNMNKRKIVICIEAKCPSLEIECKKRNPYYEAKKSINPVS